MNSSALSPRLMRPCPERRGSDRRVVSILEFEGQSWLVYNVDRNLMKIDQLGRLKFGFPHNGDDTGNISASIARKKSGNFLVQLSTFL